MQNFIQNRIQQMDQITAEGLDTCYNNFNEFLYDFWPDFAWNYEGQIKQIIACLEDKNWLASAENCRVSRGYDFKKELMEALFDEQ